MVGTLLSAALLLAGAAVTAASLAGAPSASSGSTLELNWTVSAGVVAPTRHAAQAALLVNGAWRGPVVEAVEGDTVVLTLRNEAPSPVSLHFHGLSQRGTPRADGVARASTPALRSGETGRWVFEASPAGTHFWHGHAGLAAALGLHGALVVRPRTGEPLPYDAEAPPLLFSDFWAARDVANLSAGLTARGASFAWVGNPDALLLNGADASPAAGAAVPLPPGRTLRLRLIGASTLSYLNLAADGHTLRVIEADGAPVAPFDARSVDLNAGERLSVLLTPSDEARRAGVVWLAAATRHRAGGATARVVLMLPPMRDDASAPAPTPAHIDEPPAVPLPTQPAWNDTAATFAWCRSLRAGPGVEAPPAAEAEPLVLLGTQNRVDGLMRWSLNNVSFAYPGDPVLAVQNADDAAPDPESAAVLMSDDHGGSPLMIDVASATAHGDAHAASQQAAWVRLGSAAEAQNRSGGRYARSAAAEAATSALFVPFGAVVDLVLQNAPALNGVEEQHPWHMHGGAFWVMAWGEGDWPGAQAAAQLMQSPPPLKDTATLPPGGWLWLRLRADNAGIWPLHCHILWHLAMGMATTLVVAPERITPPQG